MLSLPDWAFYPISAAAAAGMIAAAMSFGDTNHRTPEEIRAEGITFEGESLAALTVGNGLTVEFLTENGIRFARVSAARAPLDGIQSAGAFFTLTTEEIEALQGHRIRLTYTLRAASSNGADEALLNFFTPGRSQQDWERHLLAPEFDTITMDLSPTTCEWGFGYVGLWPDWRSSQNQADLSRVELTALEAVPCSDQAP
ncbi:hypothetical protein AWH62_11440 [Maricaulis sp. W15]|uniref:Uncharacterized protein n=1 Tax=Maricaulis maris TaxID=74318 RepID=A0A495CY85_9PROT|nr:MULTISPECIES: hypothetical protein [Maricaulis]OLF71745.1 hypothetical protein AWH62_11440 [Maricaulis sp. W15]RKQ94153.1 hypothetical protein C7435_3125 [Maricaulis maris]